MGSNSALSARAKARGLFLPEDEPKPARNVVWDGRAMYLVEGDGTIERCKYTYKSGEKMIGFVEQPCTESSKLIAGEYRAINAHSITKEGEDWKPGNRYSCTNQKLDCHIAGEPVLSNGKFTAHLLDAGSVPFKKGKIMWSEGRFAHVSGRMSHAEYETMCKKISDTTQWSASRPESKFEPGYAEYTIRPIAWERQQAMTAPLPKAPEGTMLIREQNGDVTAVPDTSALAHEFGASRLVPARHGAIPNSAAAFSVHKTATTDLRWLTRSVAQRTAGSVPITGPGDIPFFEKTGTRGGTVCPV